ncbi:MAG TPA: hypothetical protein VM282_19885 [Acidimicrobiales bacterium]|nr:hypothetical protein [Acidimicrobiales bacterium]
MPLPRHLGKRDYAQTVRNSGEALLTIINDILDLTKVEAGKLDIEDIDSTYGPLSTMSSTFSPGPRKRRVSSWWQSSTAR